MERRRNLHPLGAAVSDAVAADDSSGSNSSNDRNAPLLLLSSHSSEEGDFGNSSSHLVAQAVLPVEVSVVAAVVVEAVGEVAQEPTYPPENQEEL